MSSPPGGAVAPAAAAAGSAFSQCSPGLNPYGRGHARSSMLDKIIQSNSWSTREPAWKLFNKIAGNILNQPNEAKFRKLNLDKVLSKLDPRFIGLRDLLRDVGFVSEGEYYILPASTSLDLLCAALCAWNEREERSAAAREEAEKIRLANMAAVQAEKAKREANRAHLRALGADARKNVASKPVVASQGNELKFGSTLCKAPPPPPAAKGG